MKLWGRRVLRGAASAATGGRDDVGVYRLRHSHASALHYCEDHTLPRVLKRLGPSSQVHFQHYAHVIDAAEGKPRRVGLDALIASARAELEFPVGSRAADRLAP